MPKIYGDLEFQGSTRAVVDNNGTALLPGITFNADLNTGMYRHAADVLGFSTAGVLRLLINDEGALVLSDVPVTPSTTTNKLYADGGSLFWNGIQIDGGNFLSNVVEDTTPQLGGNLDVAGFDLSNSVNNILDIVGYFNTSGAGGGISVRGGASTTSTGGSASFSGGQGTSGAAAAIRGGAGTSASGGQCQLAGGDGPTGGGKVRIQVGRDTTDGSADGTIDLEKPFGITAPELHFHEAGTNGTNYIGLKAPTSVTTDLTYTLPTAPAGNGYLMASTTAGVMSWTDPSSLGVSFPLLAPDGTNSAPSYSFADDTGTGMYSSAATAIAFTSNGSIKLIIDNDEVKTFAPIHATAGNAGAPGLSFNGDIDTGLYISGTNEIGFSAGGNNIVTIGTTGLSMANGSVIFADEIASTPSYSFVNDTNTGIGAHATGDRLQFYAGGTNALDIRATYINPLIQTRTIDGTAGAPSYSFASNQTTGIFKDGATATDPIAFSVNSQESLNIESDGTLNVAAVTDYETLVTLDDDIPNKKYVDDSVTGAGTAVQLIEYTASAGQTVFGGPDNNAVTLAYTVGQLYVYKNGVLLEDTVDYVATDGTSVVLNTGAALNDVIHITAFSTIVGVGASASDYTFTATAAQTTFTGADDNAETLSYTAGKLLVYLNGALLIDGTDYTATNGTDVVLTVAASTGNILQVYEWGGFNIGAQSNILNQFLFTASASQTVFSGADDNANTLAYSTGDQKVYLNGALIEEGNDYSAPNGTSITLNSGAALNDIIQITAFGTFSVANHYTKGEIDNKYNKFSIQFLLPVGANDTYTMQQSAQFGFTIDKTYYQTSAGTITGNVQIGGVSVTGMSALSFTSTEGNSTATDNRVVAEGDKVTLVTTSTSGATMVSIILHCTRT